MIICSIFCKSPTASIDLKRQIECVSPICIILFINYWSISCSALPSSKIQLKLILLEPTPKHLQSRPIVSISLFHLDFSIGFLTFFLPVSLHTTESFPTYRADHVSFLLNNASPVPMGWAPPLPVTFQALHNLTLVYLTTFVSWTLPWACDLEMLN